MEEDVLIDDDGLHIDGHFFLEYQRLEDGAIEIKVYDKDHDFYAGVTSENLHDVFRHALHYCDPLISANLFPDHYDWQKSHKIKFSEVEDGR